MKKYFQNDYTQIELPEELLTSFAKVLVPDIKEFYNSIEGKSYFEKWLAIHPEYRKNAPDTNVSGA